MTIVHLLLNRNVQRFLFAGAMFGVLFPVSAILFEIYRHNYPLNLSSIIMIHNNSPILFMIDTAPFFLGIFAFVAGVKNARLEKARLLLEEISIVDDLTKIHNRMYGQRKLEEMIVQAKANERKIAVIFIDIDRFKAFNDNLGHWFGDQLLVAFAKRLKEEQQDGEVIARLGGDEFLILLESAQTPDEMDTVICRYARLFPYDLIVGEKPYRVNASFGVSVFPDNGDKVPALFKSADVALCENKRTKKRDYELFDDQMLIKITEDFVLEKELQNALKLGEFTLNYQPILEIESRTIVAVEALLRWNNPALGSVSPEKFIPIAESKNLIVEIGTWVIQEACRQHTAWQSYGVDRLMISVNVSANQLIYPDFVNIVRESLLETGLNAKCLVLEITESVSMENIEEIKKIFQELNKMEVRLSIDDFGTGYSSLAELKSLSVDQIKIDRSFIEDINESGTTDSVLIVDAIVGMAKKMKLKVVAEGVETAEQLSFLKRIGCDFAQGYFFSKPLNAADFLRLLGK